MKKDKEEEENVSSVTTATAAPSPTMRITCNFAAMGPSDTLPLAFPMTSIATKTSTQSAAMLNYRGGPATGAEQPIPVQLAVLNLGGQLSLSSAGKAT